MARSSAVVSLMLEALPSTRVTGRPAHSATAASSVMSSRPAARARSCAARMSAKWKPCGVCARHRPARSSVAATRLSGPACLSVSARGTAASAPGEAAERLEHPVDDVGREERPGGIVDQHPVRCVRRERAEAVADGDLPRRPARYGGEQPAVPEACNRIRVERLVAGRDHDLHHIDAGVVQEDAQRAGENGDAADARILLRAAARKPACRGRQRRSARQSSSHAPPEWNDRALD